MRFPRRSTSVVALVASLILVASGAHAGALVPDPVKTGAKYQVQGTGNADYFAWTQYVANRKGWEVWVEPTGGVKFPVNLVGDGYAGAVDQTGSMLAWQRVTNNHSDVKLFDMASLVDVPLPSGINTSRWECCSGVFGTMFTFVRITNSAFKLYLVTDLSTGAKIKFTTVDFPTVIYSWPRLYGNWIVWSTINGSGEKWRSYRYDIANDIILRIPNPLHKWNYAPSVDVAGNVYFIRSGHSCGASVRFMKWDGDLADNPVVLYSFDPGIDAQTTSVFDEGLGTVKVYVDFLDCSAGESDIYSFTNP
jgi:hypothetical protein